MVTDEERRRREILGERLKDFRVNKKMTLDIAAKKSGISKGAISSYENGESAPTLDRLQILLLTYGASLYDYFGIEKADYENDLNVFKRYGLSDTFYQELFFAKNYRAHNDIAYCINLILEYPLYAFTLFEELAHFFNTSYHEMVDRIPLRFPPDASVRLLLEPVICTLGNIFNAKYPERQKNAILSMVGEQAESQAVVQAKLFKEAQQHKKH